MSKYDVELILDEGTSFIKLIKMLKRNTLILEFGPANGRFTKYLKENMNCQVHIVEINKEDFNKAMQYASDGICSDIETMEWKEYFKDNRYDHIIFTDVLEHLREPQKIFNACADFIKEDGSILFSIPNAAHGDIIANLYNNDFKYTELGLLDNTHIHLFAYKNIVNMVEKSKLKLNKLDIVYAPLKHTEQHPTYNNEIIYYVINEKQFANVYQFIGECKKKSENTPDKNIFIEDIHTKQKYIEVYYGDNSCKLKKLLYKKQNNYECSINDIPVNINNIRIDPTSDKLCLIKNISIKERVDYNIKHNGIQVGDEIYFFTFDPQIYIESNSKHITLSFNMKEYSVTDFFVLINEYTICMNKAMENICKALTEKESHEEFLLQKINQDEKDKNILIKQINQSEEDKKILSKHIDRLENDKATLLQKINQDEKDKNILIKQINQSEEDKKTLSKHIDRLEKDKELILATLKQKEKENILLDDAVQLHEKENKLIKTQLDNIVNEYDAIKYELTSLINSHSWKITRPLRWIAKKIKRNI